MNVVCVSSCMLAWTLLYSWLCYMMPHKSCEWNCRIVAAFHAMLVICITIWSMFFQGPNPFTDPDGVLGGPNTRLHAMVCVMCIGYFLYDLIWSIIFKTEVVMLLHHVLSIYGTSFVLYRGVNGAELMATLWGSEITNPFLQLRWFLRETDQYQTWYAELNNVVFILLFTGTRVCIGSWFMYIYVHHPRPDLASKIGSFTFYVMSMVLWAQIVLYAVRHFKIVPDNREPRPEVKPNNITNGDTTQQQPSRDTRDSDANGSVVVRRSNAVQ